MASVSFLGQKSVLVIFAYSPAGLGHLRVTDALYEGLPETVTPILLGSQDKAIGWLHRFLSIHPITRSLFEWGQQGFIKYFFTFIYIFFLHSRTKLLYQQLLTIIDERLIIPDTIVVVATHFGLAHQLAHIKEKIMQEKKIKVLLFVQVTDDSPQPIWYVPESDMTFVPSAYTKETLSLFCKRFRLPSVPMTVTPYPLSPFLSQRLSPEHHHNRIEQVKPASKAYIHIALPVPGAAVGTEFLTKLINYLHAHHDYVFAVYTASFR